MDKPDSCFVPHLLRKYYGFIQEYHITFLQCRILGRFQLYPKNFINSLKVVNGIDFRKWHSSQSRFLEGRNRIWTWKFVATNQFWDEPVLFHNWNYIFMKIGSDLFLRRRTGFEMNRLNFVHVIELSWKLVYY